MFNHTSNSYNQVLLISTVGILGFLLARYVRSKYIFNYDELNKHNIEKKIFYILLKFSKTNYYYLLFFDNIFSNNKSNICFFSKRYNT